MFPIRRGYVFLVLLVASYVILLIIVPSASLKVICKMVPVIFVRVAVSNANLPTSVLSATWAISSTLTRNVNHVQIIVLFVMKQIIVCSAQEVSTPIMAHVSTA
jgi:hypothetical protein